jgi:glutamate--cysteine ligase
VFQSVDERLRAFSNEADRDLFRDSLKGIEREGLRVSPDGGIAHTDHPRCLGSALTHPYITTDYSEALLELITPPFANLEDTLDFLTALHAWVAQCLNNELIWATSMPCKLESDDKIPIARYGTSNVGTMKHVYRRGLAHRYGRAMQTIAGLHFNYSFPEGFWRCLRMLEGRSSTKLQDYTSAGYFALIRNFQRVSWLVPFLFGASPAVCKSFFQGRAHELPDLDRYTQFGEYATSLRMSDIGYRNSNQAGLDISFNDLDSYVDSLARAISTPFPDYVAMGVKVDGEYRQLNANILQIENEYYSFVRPKQTAWSGEKPTLALKRRGVEYVEIRALDINIYNPLGATATELRFIEALLLLCALAESPPISHTEQRVIDNNTLEIAVRGRDANLYLQIGNEKSTPRQWAERVFDSMTGVCELLDRGEQDTPYRAALDAQRNALATPETLPSARILAELHDNNESFFEFAMRFSQQHDDFFRNYELDEHRKAQFASVVADSLLRQQDIESSDDISFDEYLERYFSQ